MEVMFEEKFQILMKSLFTFYSFFYFKLCVWGCVHVIAGTLSTQKEASEPLELELQVGTGN